MGKILAAGALLVFVIAGCSKKSTSSVTPLNSTDQQFVTNAGYNNVDEINAGYLASTDAADTNVKLFGMRMVNDYGNAQSALILLADSLGFTVVSGPDSAHQQFLDNLKNQAGVNFDTTYLRAQINDDQAAITLYQAEQNAGQNAAVKAYIGKYLPIIQAHLGMADSLILKQQGH